MSSPGRVGIELELCAPQGTSREDLAASLADRVDGESRWFFHAGAEPSAHPQFVAFHNLTPGFAVTRHDGSPFATLVDDVTLISGLRRDAPAKVGWHRIVSDERRLLQILGRLIDATDPMGPSLSHACDVLGLEQRRQPGLCNLVGDDGATYAMIAALPGERERPTEVVSPPLNAEEVEPWLASVTSSAIDLGFSPAIEGATHLHFDAAPFDNAESFRRLIAWFVPRREALRSLVHSNPLCTAVGPLPIDLGAFVESPDFLQDPWPQTRSRILATGITKFADLNLVNLVQQRRELPTIEFRMLPASTDPREIADWAFGLGGCLRSLSIDPPIQPWAEPTYGAVKRELAAGTSGRAFPGLA